MERYFVFGYVNYEAETFKEHFDNLKEAIKFATQLKGYNFYHIYDFDMQEVTSGKLKYV